MPIKQIFIPRHELIDILVALLVSVAQEAYETEVTYIEDLFRHGVRGVTSMNNEEIISEIMSLTDNDLRNCFSTISGASRTFASQYKSRADLDKVELILEVLNPTIVKLEELVPKLAQYESMNTGGEALVDLLINGCVGWSSKSNSEVIKYINENITDEGFQDITGLKPGMQIIIGNLPVKLH